MLQKSYLGSKGSGAKLALGTYPYTYARVSVMRSFLLRKDEYHKLMKMNVNEIIGYLQNSQYRKEIDELAGRYRGVELMELALNRNLANTWAKLKKISPASLRVLISTYLLRGDIWNVKTLVRAKYTKLSPEQLPAMLLPSGFLNEKKLSELMKKDSIEEVLKSIGFIDQSYFSQALERFKETKSVAEIENALDRFYYSVMEEFSRRLPDEGRLFREFLELETEVAAIMNVLRLKRANTPSKDIENFIVTPVRIRALVKKMVSSQSAADAAKLLESSRLRAFVEAGVKEFISTGSLVALELDLLVQLLKRSALLIHQHPLSVDVILGYMFAKEIEVRNPKLVMKAKQLGIGEGFAERQIVTV
ncbi:V-type ATPase subunit [Candidatus Woesearchaeota archaeon]|nr:V-type ATPase subunit [Candidatus Woesearchaeota archaeon]